MDMDPTSSCTGTTRLHPISGFRICGPPFLPEKKGTTKAFGHRRPPGPAALLFFSLYRSLLLSPSLPVLSSSPPSAVVMGAGPNQNPSAGGADQAAAAAKPPPKDLKKKKDEKKEEDLSDEDLALKQQLELYVERVQDSDPGVQKLALESMRNLAGEITEEYAKRQRQSEDIPIDDIMELVQQIVAFHMKHNAEPEAVDLLMEVEDPDLLVEHVDSTNYKRACLYLTSASSYLPGPDDILALDIAYMIYLKFEDWTSALRIALFLDKIQYVKQVYTSCDDLLQKKQFSFIFAQHGLVLELDDEMVVDDSDREALQDIINNGLVLELDDEMVVDDSDREALQDIINNVKLSEGYLTLARDVEVMEPKSPEDIYKAHLIDGRASASASLDSARQNLAATFVNAFVNAGFGQDKLMTVTSESSSGSTTGSWLFKNKEHGKASAAASLALAILNDYITKDDPTIRIGAIMGLGLAYAGSQKEELKLRLTALINDPSTPLEVLVFSALTLGLVYVGSCCEEVAQLIIIAIMERSEAELNDPLTRFLPLALGLLYLGKQVNVMDTLSRLSHDADSEVSMAAIISLGLIGAGTNNARIAGMLRNLSSYYYKEAGHLFCVRIAQGLVHLGKGLLTLSPYHSDHFLLSPIRLAGLITILHACLDLKSTILGKYHYMLYFLVLAVQPRMLLTVDENLKPLSVPVRVGQAVDVVGQAGRPKTITGFQTHSTPVLLAAGERAELATEKIITPLACINVSEMVMQSTSKPKIQGSSRSNLPVPWPPAEAVWKPEKFDFFVIREGCYLTGIGTVHLSLHVNHVRESLPVLAAAQSTSIGALHFGLWMLLQVGFVCFSD
ncbi:hypothetical protein Taro_036905 [Colocasia esculenta]|uniref:26S proteasome non-ATPase regulatory subunit 2 homolog n=1 Tax=Colocasia esculenta TaxID=4460 RepID=A0A843W4A9_COLES|nr:hypothetical protein [Colocasia esculenta]